ncbi:DUF7504 family protein [Halorarius litoreus]|uniref:DUF7504 family protein n=1 Tax=Halorarius litoreus TaxID=2962676 RepID=UPI0020CCA7CE|nr:hypothetical protein [Halorarius litoreus]
MAMESGAANTEAAAFTQALAALKRRGSNLLVVGATAGHTHTDACSRLLGDSSVDRTRLFVTTDRHGGTTGTDACLGDDTVIEYATTTRGAAAAQPATAGGSTLEADVTQVEDLPALGRAVSAAIDTAAADGLDPAELRLCFDSLRPLLEEQDEESVFRFLHALTSEVRSVQGMAHYHLPVAFDTRTVRTFSPLFDAVVELRTQGGHPQQRWHLHEADVTTDWLDL